MALNFDRICQQAKRWMLIAGVFVIKLQRWLCLCPGLSGWLRRAPGRVLDNAAGLWGWHMRLGNGHMGRGHARGLVRVIKHGLFFVLRGQDQRLRATASGQ